MTDRDKIISEPLPMTIKGRFRALLFIMGLSLLMLAVGAGMIWSGLGQGVWEFILRLFLGSWPILVGALFVYMGATFTWRLKLLPDKLIVRTPLREHYIPLEWLQSIRLVISSSSRQPSDKFVAMVLTPTNGRSLRITQQEMPLALTELQRLMVEHYRLPLFYEKEPADVHHTNFGSGSRRPFAHYLGGESLVRVQSLPEICRWLQECSYVSDPELFNQRDVWQHPGEFEALQKGDCEDHALWAWRKLVELGLPAEFVVGRTSFAEQSNGAHAWVSFQENGRDFLLETTHKNRIVYPAEDVQNRYHPWFSVDGGLQTYRFLPVAGHGNNGEVRSKK